MQVYSANSDQSTEGFVCKNEEKNCPPTPIPLKRRKL